MVVVVNVGIRCNACESIFLYKTAHLITWCKKKDEVLSKYEFRKEIVLIWIQKKTANVAENDNNNKRGRDDVTRSSSGSSIETRGKKNLG